MSAIVRRSKVLVIGSGGNAMSVAIKVREAGIGDVWMISKHSDFGGVWHQNTYPGCGVDGPVTLYQLSYYPSGDWSRLFATQPELLAYFQEVARHYGLYDVIDFDTEMTRSRWIEEDQEWEVETDRGVYRTQHLVLATGFLDEPNVPDIPGLSDFKGNVFHSSSWPEGYVGEDHRVAVIGTGSSALQIVASLQRTAAALTVFQRTPTWILPKDDRPLTDEERTLYRGDVEAVRVLREEALLAGDQHFADVFRGDRPDAAAEVQAGALAYLHDRVSDPALREKLTPSHRYACKRPGASDDYYDALSQPNVELIAEAAAHIDATGITSVGGTRVEVDTLVLATGFFWGTHILGRIHRRDGLTVREAQQGHPRAYRSISVSGAPNLYLVGGAAPNGRYFLGLVPGERAGIYVSEAVKYMDKAGVRALEVLEEAQDAWKARADEALAKGPAVSGDCVSYILDETGHNSADWPGGWHELEEQLTNFDPTPYVVPTVPNAEPTTVAAR
ncbi:flavin-containing monooxygenase [Nocardia pseudovaccinii]|uniref:flavin-containing monooxygenase n=1 Tax=Nocardia pseudovaccinii TaxID=189540 RepID=UPI003D90CBED